MIEPKKKRLLDISELVEEVGIALDVEFECEADLLFAGFSELRYKIWGKEHPFVEDDIGSYLGLIKNLNQFRAKRIKTVNNENLAEIAEFYSKAAATLYWIGQDSLPTERIARKLELLVGAAEGNLSVKVLCMRYDAPHQCKSATSGNERRTLEQEMSAPRLPKPECTRIGLADGYPDEEVDDEGNLIATKMPGLCNCIYQFDRIDLMEPSWIDEKVFEIEANQAKLRDRRILTANKMISDGWNDTQAGWSDEFRRRMGVDN